MRSLPDVLYNFHWVVRVEVARSAQAYAGFLRPFLKSHGIASLINLRGTNPRWSWWRNEKRNCAAIGVVHRDVKFNSRRLPTRALLLDLLAAFDEAPRPILLKCSGGQDRTSFAAALYLLHTRGMVAHAQAEAQFARWPYLHLPKRQQKWLKLFLTYIEDDIGSRSLRDWIQNNYSPESFKMWLEKQGHGQTFRGLYTLRPSTTSTNNARHEV